MDRDYGNNLTNSHIPVSFRADLARFWKLPHTDDDDTSTACNLTKEDRDGLLCSSKELYSQHFHHIISGT